MSTYDQLILKGKIEGKKEGKKEQALLFAEKLIREFPTWTDAQIAEFSGATVKEMHTIGLRLAN